MRTALCERLGIDYPVIQAPIGGAAGPALAAAVSDAGGLGALALTGWGGAGTRSRIREVRRETTRPVVGKVLLSYDVSSPSSSAMARRAAARGC